MACWPFATSMLKANSKPLRLRRLAVSAQPAEPLTDGLILIRAMFGDEPQTPERPVEAPNTEESTALLVPAI